MTGMLRVRNLTPGRLRIDVSHGYAEHARIANDRDAQRAFAQKVADLIPDVWLITSLRVKAHPPASDYVGFIAIAETAAA